MHMMCDAYDQHAWKKKFFGWTHFLLVVLHHSLATPLPFFPFFFSVSMSDQEQEEQEQDQGDLGEQSRPNICDHHQELLKPMIGLLLLIAHPILIDAVHPCLQCNPTPYHTSALTGAEWVVELLNGHPEHIRNELGVHRSTFIILVKALKLAGIESSCHVSLEEQLGIYLYTMVMGLSCTHVGGWFQQLLDTITRWVWQHILTPLTYFQVF